MFTATHIPTGRTVEIQDTMEDYGGTTMYYCEDHMRPSMAGWCYAESLIFN